MTIKISIEKIIHLGKYPKWRILSFKNKSENTDLLAVLLFFTVKIWDTNVIKTNQTKPFYIVKKLSITFEILTLSDSVKLEPEGKHKPLSNKLSETFSP